MQKHVTFASLPEALGINPLTGESCTYSMRILCDLNERGVALVRAWLGLPEGAALAPSWNLRVGDAPAVASVMLDRDVFARLALFGLLREGWHYVVQKGDITAFVAFTGDDTECRRYLTEFSMDDFARYGWKLHRNPRPAAIPNTHVIDDATRNVHAFTGRAV